MKLNKTRQFTKNTLTEETICDLVLKTDTTYIFQYFIMFGQQEFQYMLNMCERYLSGNDMII